MFATSPQHTAVKPFGISLTHVSMKRGHTYVFSDLSLDLTQHRIGLIGDNGAGKSSLFRLICGLDTATTGNVHLPKAKQSERVVGMMFQNSDEQIIFPTVEEELALSLHHLNLPRAQTLSRVQAWLASQGLTEWGTRTISSLSQGQRQRVCWWSLLLADHQILLLDEPFASLDLPSQARLNQDIANATQQIIVSTHQLDHVRQFERVIWLEKGQVRADGIGTQVCQAYEAHVAQQITP